MSKPNIPKGTRDFSPEEVAKRNYIFNVLKSHFQQFGFLPIETPSMEKLSTLTGKYGDEGDQLLFKLLKRGAKFEKALNHASKSEGNSDHQFSEEALRYDLTVPFARYVVQHLNDITFPFKRYQIQPVWRADRPQRGRYREFYQCDVDVVGTTSLNAELELIQIINHSLSALKLPNHTIHLNNRKILYALISSCGELSNFNKITVIIDKLDKVGKEKVLSELADQIKNPSCTTMFESIFDLGNDYNDIISWLKSRVGATELGLEGIEEVSYIFENCSQLGLKNITLNLTLARGLNYYTGTIFEVILNDYNMGSVVGGGRYDNLTALFGLKDISGVGISFGAERIYDVLNESQLFPEDISVGPEFLIIDQSNAVSNAFKVAEKLRELSKRSMIYPDKQHKLKKKLKYANQNKIPYVLFISDNFNDNMSLELKDMITGEQKSIQLKQIIHEING